MNILQQKYSFVIQAFEKSVQVGETAWKLKKDAVFCDRTHLDLVIDLSPDILIQILVSRHITLMYIVTFQIRNCSGHIQTLFQDIYETQ